MENPKRYTLVHGVVSGQGPLEGIEYCHAWVLDGDDVIDDTLPPDMRRIPADLYYSMGNIELTREYDWHDVAEMLDEYGTYGPWDDVFDPYP